MASVPPDSGIGPDGLVAEGDVLVAPSRPAALTIKLEPELYDRLRLAAIARDTTTQRLVLDALEHFLGTQAV